MKTKIRISFNSTGLKSFYIENPRHLPSQGEIFNCKWSDYIEDKEQIRRLEKIQENECWMVDRLSIYYSKDEIICQIVLFESIHFEEDCG
ncbi:hypothetical protein [Carboxylicivirga sp. M1479]|uniref:hypothetical protein n=1 Tax=Carboxylicivirga sp. M1479 TaxID=2594476 RepID=UPI001177B99A|nr:hypothetical protein [Carboxylicivirga sp. M1479]TRX70865.1 hypothetical protein FNN09_09385 [Carboxylicivirga sp. M1479]